MFPLVLTDEQKLLLTNLLENAIEDLRSEIHETDRSAYKEMLKTRREEYQKILEHLKPVEQLISK
jgi:hypothetical protein